MRCSLLPVRSAKSVRKGLDSRRNGQLIGTVEEMDDDTRRLLNDLDAAIHRSLADGRIDDDEKAELRSLVDRVERALGNPGHKREGVVERLESTAVRLEVDHPSLAGLLRSAAESLGASGI